MNKPNGLLGRKLSHSFSPEIHGLLGDYEYRLFEKEPDELKDFILGDEYGALNVTIPYKTAVIPYCDRLTETAAKIGAVNTIFRQDGKLVGGNTDYYGFDKLIERSGVTVAGKKAVVLGSGGASKTVCAVLRDRGASEVVIISRSGENNYENLFRHSDGEIIVNATPVGMYPDNGNAPVSLSAFPNCVLAVDLIYNPLKTAFLLDGERRGIRTANGLYMLVCQAKRASELFSGVSVSDGICDEIYSKLTAKQTNLILIGMPGCGKSSVGRILAERLHRQLFDIDELIVEHAGMSIPEIFTAYGESGFREMESRIVRETGKKTGAVIACGGGVVTRQENLDPLCQNGRIVFIDRLVSELPTSGRPLSQRISPKKLYQERLAKYLSWSDRRIVTGGMSPEQVAERILENENFGA